jgi:hypothetical protein
MKTFSAICAVVMMAASIAIAKPKEWSESEATVEAQRDFRTHHIKFYWHGGYAAMAVGVPAEYAYIPDRYPHADGGNGCIVRDRALRERQRKFSETYNKLMLSLILQSQ